MLEILVDNIFVVFAGKVFQQTVGIPMGTNYAPLLADIFLYSYEADFIQSLLSTGKKHLASRFNLTYRYIDDVLSINNPEFENYLGHMYPAELEIKDTTESTTSASYQFLFLQAIQHLFNCKSVTLTSQSLTIYLRGTSLFSKSIKLSQQSTKITTVRRKAQASYDYDCYVFYCNFRER